MASAGTVEQVSSSDESSDGDDDNPLSSLIAVHPPVCPPEAELLPVEPIRDFSDDEEEDQASVGELLSKAIHTVGSTADVSYYFSSKEAHYA